MRVVAPAFSTLTTISTSSQRDCDEDSRARSWSWVRITIGTRIGYLRRCGIFEHPRAALAVEHTTCYKRPMRLHDYAPRPAHVNGLLDSDPAIRWQVMRILTGEAPNTIGARGVERCKRRLGAQLLARQSPAGPLGDGRSGTLLPSTVSSF